MNLPKGPVWQLIRADCLASVPGGGRSVYRTPFRVDDWTQRGSYRVLTAQPSGFSIEADARDLGNTLLSEAEYLLDHTAEQGAVVHARSAGAGWDSAAWATVTVYYWAFYACLALTRLVGRTVWYLDAPAVRALHQLANVPRDSRPGSGSYRASVRPLPGSLTMCSLDLRRDKKRLHAAVWHVLFDALRAYSGTIAPSAQDPAEQRLYAAIIRCSDRLGADWPSAIRNVVNYRPGFGYAVVRGNVCLDTAAYLRSVGGTSIDRAIDGLESELPLARTTPLIAAKQYARLLVNLTFLLQAVVRTLYEELLERNALDRRWALNRNGFLRARGLFADGRLWPC